MTSKKSSARLELSLRTGNYVTLNSPLPRDRVYSILKGALSAIFSINILWQLAVECVLSATSEQQASPCSYLLLSIPTLTNRMNRGSFSGALLPPLCTCVV